MSETMHADGPAPEPDYGRLLRANLERVFNERDPGKRAAALDALFVAEPVMFEPTNVVAGRAAIAAVAGTLLEQFGPTFRFTPLGPAVGHHGLGWLPWQAGPEGGAGRGHRSRRGRGRRWQDRAPLGAAQPTGLKDVRAVPDGDPSFRPHDDSPDPRRTGPAIASGGRRSWRAVLAGDPVPRRAVEHQQQGAALGPIRREPHQTIAEGRPARGSVPNCTRRNRHVRVVGARPVDRRVIRAGTDRPRA
jgi:hypothetical protein